MTGTAQGNWFTGGKDVAADSPETWKNGLALVHDNADPTMGVVAVGGVIGDPLRLTFTPSDDGTINREFSEVKPDSNSYCYSGAARGQTEQTKQRLLVQMTSQTTLQVEIRPDSCSDDNSFSKPTTYER